MAKRTFSDGTTTAAAESTLASGISIAGVSAVVQAGHGTRFSAAGDYSVRIEKPTDPTDFELLTCTTRSTDTLTISAAVKAWAIGDKITQVIAKADFDKFLQTFDSPTNLIGPFEWANLAASQTAVKGGRGASSITLLPIVMLRAGSITGLSVASTEARTAGTATFEVYKNDVATGFSVVIDGTNVQYVRGTQAVGLDTFVAGDRLDVRVTTDAGWLPTGTAELLAELEIKLDQ